MILQSLRILFVVLTRGIFQTAGLPLSEFYPFGQQNGDTSVQKIDDGSSSKVEININFPFFNRSFSSLYVNSNGGISFNTPFSAYTPAPFPLSSNIAMVTPYWCDIDIRNGGDIWYYQTIDKQLIQTASQDVRKMFPSLTDFDANWLFVATWDNVTYFGAVNEQLNKRNTFQTLLITNGRQSFAVFLYNKIEWIGNRAQVGFDAGDGVNFLAINESRTASVINVTLLSNVGVPGKFAFRLDSKTVTSARCMEETGMALAIFPRHITMFGGTQLSISVPCVDDGDRIEIEFERVSGRLPCKRVSQTAIRCISPTANITGDVKVHLFIHQLENNEQSTRPVSSNVERNITKTITYSGISTYINPLDKKKSILYQMKPESWILDEDVTIAWDSLPFTSTSDTVEIEQFSVELHNERGVTLISDGYVGKNISKVNQQHTFRLSTQRQAVIFRLHPEPKSKDYIDNVPLVPSVWSDVFIPPLAPLTNDSQKIRSYCNAWKMRDSTKQSVNSTDVEICPCNIKQVRLDITRFVADPLCTTHSNGYKRSNCTFNPGAEQCVRMVFLGQNGNDIQCCYDNNGTLIETEIDEFGGFTHRYHYKGGSDDNIPYLSNIYDDIVPFVYCCQFYSQYSPNQNDLCTDFLSRRPVSRCKGYIPPRIASTSGDPHMVTLDGLQYTFNGVGEFILVTDLDEKLNIQARMEQFKDENGVAMPASVVTSVAIQCNSSEAVVEIRLNEIRLVDILLNGELVDFTDTYSLQKNGRLKGLLGNYNGRTDDDLTNRNGDVIPINSTLEYVHNNFGLTWMTNATESLFTYPDGKTHETFQNKDFEPEFDPSDQCTMNVTQICGNDPACQFDLCTTNDSSVAAFTRQASEEINLFAELTVPACGVLVNVPNGDWTYSGYSASFNCENGFSQNFETTVQCGQDGQWLFTYTCDQTGL